MDRRGVAALMSALVMLAVTPAASAMEGPCKRDFAKYCPNVEPGGGRLLKCFEEHKDNMSAGCRYWVDGVKASISELQDVCGKDIASFCNFEQGDAIGVVSCLQGKYVSLEPDCRDTVHQIQYRYPQAPK